jgi:hypothetical protein
MSNKINFAIKGTLRNLYSSRGFGSLFPTFIRPTPIFIERDNNNSIDLIPISSNDPAIYPDGSFALAPGIENLIPNSDRLNAEGWVRGSNVFVRSNIDKGSVELRQEADAIVVGARQSGNEKGQIFRRVISIPHDNSTYTAWTLLRLGDGVLGANDVFRVALADGSILASTNLESKLVLNQNNPVDVQFSLPADLVSIGQPIEIHIEWYIENSCTLYITGLQLEKRDFRSLFVYQDNEIKKVAESILYYQQSPIEGLGSFGIFFRVVGWRGNGNIIQSGDVKISLESNQLVVTKGNERYLIEQDLPQKFACFVQIATETQSINVYIDGILVWKRSLGTGTYRLAPGPMLLTTKGVRVYSLIATTNAYLEDGLIDVGQVALREVGDLFTKFFIPPELLTSAPQKFVTDSVKIPASQVDAVTGMVAPGYAEVRFPFRAIDPVVIEELIPASNAIRVTSSISFIEGNAYVRSPDGRNIRTVRVAGINPVNKLIYLSTLELLEVGMIIAQPTPSGETLIPTDNYRVEFLHPVPGVKVFLLATDGIALRNNNPHPVTVVPMLVVVL